jgi:ATP-dependent DNA helicase RecQ
LKELQAVPESTIVARKILSCVARVRQTWGIGHVSDVLTGRANEKIVAAGHDQLSTFGLLKNESGAAVRGYLEQLVAEGLLAREGDPYPVLRLTPAGTRLLKGDGDFPLYREIQPPPPDSFRGRRGAGQRRQSPGSVDQELFDALRAVRQRIARERGVPPYVVFHDTSLLEMAARRPVTVADLHEIYGVGAKKAADFGEAFLSVIRNHPPSAIQTE